MLESLKDIFNKLKNMYKQITSTLSKLNKNELFKVFSIFSLIFITWYVVQYDIFCAKVTKAGSGSLSSPFESFFITKYLKNLWNIFFVGFVFFYYYLFVYLYYLYLSLPNLILFILVYFIEIIYEWMFFYYFNVKSINLIYYYVTVLFSSIILLLLTLFLYTFYIFVFIPYDLSMTMLTNIINIFFTIKHVSALYKIVSYSIKYIIFLNFYKILNIYIFIKYFFILFYEQMIIDHILLIKYLINFVYYLTFNIFNKNILYLYLTMYFMYLLNFLINVYLLLFNIIFFIVVTLKSIFYISFGFTVKLFIPFITFLIYYLMYIIYLINIINNFVLISIIKNILRLFEIFFIMYNNNKSTIYYRFKVDNFVYFLILFVRNLKILWYDFICRDIILIFKLIQMVFELSITFMDLIITFLVYIFFYIIKYCYFLKYNTQLIYVLKNIKNIIYTLWSTFIYANIYYIYILKFLGFYNVINFFLFFYDSFIYTIFYVFYNFKQWLLYEYTGKILEGIINVIYKTMYHILAFFGFYGIFFVLLDNFIKIIKIFYFSEIILFSIFFGLIFIFFYHLINYKLVANVFTIFIIKSLKKLYKYYIKFKLTIKKKNFTYLSLGLQNNLKKYVKYYNESIFNILGLFFVILWVHFYSMIYIIELFSLNFKSNLSDYIVIYIYNILSIFIINVYTIFDNFSFFILNYNPIYLVKYLFFLIKVSLYKNLYLIKIYIYDNYISISFIQEKFFINNDFNIIYYNYINISSYIKYVIKIINIVLINIYLNYYYLIISEYINQLLSVFNNIFIFLLDNVYIYIIYYLNCINNEILRILSDCVIQLFYNIQLLIFSFTWNKKYIDMYKLLDLYSGTEILLNSLLLKIKFKILLFVYDPKGLIFNCTIFILNSLIDIIYLSLKSILLLIKFISFWINVMWTNLYFMDYNLEYFITSFFYFPYIFIYYILNCVNNSFYFIDLYTINTLYLNIYKSSQYLLYKVYNCFYIISFGFLIKWFIILFNLTFLSLKEIISIILDIFNIKSLLYNTYIVIMFSVICNPMFYVMYESRALQLIKDGRIYRQRLIQLYFYLVFYSMLTWYIYVDTRFTENLFTYLTVNYPSKIFSILHYTYKFFAFFFNTFMYYYCLIIKYIITSIKSYLLLISLFLKTQPFIDPFKYAWLNVLVILNTIENTCNMSSLWVVLKYGGMETGIYDCYVLYSPISIYILEPLQYLLKILYIYLIFIIPLVVYVLKINLIYISYFLPMYIATSIGASIQAFDILKGFNLIVVLLFDISKHLFWFFFIIGIILFIYLFNVIYLFYLFFFSGVLFILEIFNFVSYLLMKFFFFFFLRDPRLNILEFYGYLDFPILVLFKYIINLIFYKFIDFDIFYTIGFIILKILEYIFFKVFFIFNPFVWFKYYSNHILLGYENFYIPRMDLMVLNWLFSLFFKVLLIFWNFYDFVFNLIFSPLYFIVLLSDLINCIFNFICKPIDLIIQYAIRILAVDLFEINRLFYINSKGYYYQLIHYSFLYLFSYSLKVFFIFFVNGIKHFISIIFAYVFYLIKYLIVVLLFLPIKNLYYVVKLLIILLNIDYLFENDTLYLMILYLIMHNASNHLIDFSSNIFISNCFILFINKGSSIYLTIFSMFFEFINCLLLFIYFMIRNVLNLILFKFSLLYNLYINTVVKIFNIYNSINNSYFYNKYLNLYEFLILEYFVYLSNILLKFILILPIFININILLLLFLKILFIHLIFFKLIINSILYCLYCIYYLLDIIILSYLYLIIHNIFLLFYDAVYNEYGVNFFEFGLNIFISSYFYNNIVLECVDFVNNWFIYFLFLFLFFCYVIWLQWYVSKDTKLFHFDNVEFIVISFINFMKTLIRDNSPKNIEYFGLYFVIFFMIFFFNIIGMIPYSVSITSQFVFCFTISCVMLIGITIKGISKHGFRFGGLFLNNSSPWLIWLLLVPLEIVSFISRALSLSIRLFANMTAGHVLISIFGTLISVLTIETQGFLEFIASIIIFILFSAILILELFISFLQAYVFVLLIILYVKDAESEPVH